MSNTVSLISYTQTFADWIIQTNALSKENNDLAANVYSKQTGTLILNDPTLGLQVANAAIFYGSTQVSGVGSSLSVQNLLTTGSLLAANVTVTGVFNYNANTFTLNTDGSVAETSRFVVNRGTTGANSSIRWYEPNKVWQVMDVSNNVYSELVSTKFNPANTFVTPNGTTAIPNSGVISLTCGNGITVTGSSNNLTLLLPQNLSSNANVVFNSAIFGNTVSAGIANTGEIKTSSTIWIAGNKSTDSQGQLSIASGTGSTFYGAGLWVNSGSAQFMSSNAVSTITQCYTANTNNFKPLSWNLATGAVTLDSGITQGGVTVSSSMGIGTAPDTANVGSLRCTNAITSYYSDDRLKTYMGNIPDALQKVESLNGFYYVANDLAESLGYTKKLEVGVSAQQVQRVLPEIVVPAPIDDEYLTIQYERLIPVLIEAIKELSDKVKVLENK